MTYFVRLILAIGLAACVALPPVFGGDSKDKSGTKGRGSKSVAGRSQKPIEKEIPEINLLDGRA